MTADEQNAKLIQKLDSLSQECERDVIAVRSDGNAGIILRGPNCLMSAEIFMPDMAPFDFYLN